MDFATPMQNYENTDRSVAIYGMKGLRGSLGGFRLNVSRNVNLCLSRAAFPKGTFFPVLLHI